MKPQILILGGTTEARQLPPAVPARITNKYDIVMSFSGVTKSPKVDAGNIRIGGFGGIEGLVNYIQDNHVILVIDATHPFAKAMPLHAYKACKQTGCPILRYLRPEWQQVDGDEWVYAENLTKAAEQLPLLAKNAFLSLGSRDLANFKDVSGLAMTARMIERAEDANLPKNCEVILSRPPYKLNEEEALFARLGIDIVVTKNSGANATQAKLEACRNLGIKVLMIKRPKTCPIPIISNKDQMITQLLEDL